MKNVLKTEQTDRRTGEENANAEAGASFEGGWGASPPRKNKKEKGTMKNVKSLHIKSCFFQFFFNSQVALKNLNNFAPPLEKVE